MIHVRCGRDNHSFVFSSFPLESGTTCQDGNFDERVMLRLNLDKGQIILNCQWKQRLWTEIKPSFLCKEDMVTSCNSEDMEWFLVPQTICLWNDSIYFENQTHLCCTVHVSRCNAGVLIYKPMYQLLMAPPFFLFWNNIVFLLTWPL